MKSPPGENIFPGLKPLHTINIYGTSQIIKQKISFRLDIYFFCVILGISFKDRGCFYLEYCTAEKNSFRLKVSNFLRRYENGCKSE